MAWPVFRRNRVRSAAMLAALALVFAALFAPGMVRALAVPPVPADIPVVDQTDTLSGDQKQALAAKIAKERSATGNQVAILMVKSLDGEAIEDYSIKVARGWGIGQKDRNSGVLLLVAKDDHKLRIEVGYGLEGALTDARSGQIIRDRITPQFRDGKYYEGLDSGLDGILTAIHGEADPKLQAGAGKNADMPGWVSTLISLWWVFLLVPVWLGSILARTKSWWAGGVIGAAGGGIISIFAGFLFFGLAAVVGLAVLGLVFDKLVSDNYKKAAKGDSDKPSWWAGGPWIGGGSGGGGGGFGGFSGGSFGGGGSSGSW